MTRTASGWLFLALWACVAMGCASLPALAPDLDPGPSADPTEDPAQEFLRRVRPGMPVAQARQIVVGLTHRSPSVGETELGYGITRFAFEDWRLDDGRILYLFHDGQKVRQAQVGHVSNGCPDPAQECARRIRPGMPKEEAYRILVMTATDSLPRMGSSAFGTTGGPIWGSENWTFGQTRTLTISYEGEVVNGVEVFDYGELAEALVTRGIIPPVTSAGARGAATSHP